MRGRTGRWAGDPTGVDVRRGVAPLQLVPHRVELLVARPLSRRSAIRTNDVVGRFGGEEFVIARPDTDLDDATVSADLLGSAVAASPLAAMCAGVLDDPGLEPDTFRLTVSIGMAVYPADGTTVDNLLLRADLPCTPPRPPAATA